MRTHIITSIEIRPTRTKAFDMFDVKIHYLDDHTEERRLTREGLREVTKQFLRHMSPVEASTAISESRRES